MLHPKSMIRVCLTLAFCGLFVGCGSYGKVSTGAYKSATALYAACKAKNNERLDKVESFILQQPIDTYDSPATTANSEIDHKIETAQAADLPITPTEKSWLQQIIADARQGNWDSAAQSSRRIMEDQVDY